MLETIISGGQTGVDRAALDVAIFLGIPHGGWCPRERLSEDGSIPSHYELRETASRDYSVRTEQNVVEADGTLILHYSELARGTLLTLRLCRRHRRPVLLVDLSEEAVVDQVAEWIHANAVQCLNVAGPRESSVPGINLLAQEFLLEALAGYRKEQE